MEGNGRRVTVRELGDKLDVIRSEQRAEHIKTRAIAVIGAVLGPTVIKVGTVLGFIHFH